MIRANAKLSGALLICAAMPTTSGCARQVADLPAGTPVAAKSAAQTTPVIDAGPQTITWDRLDLPIPPDSKFEPWMMTTRVEALEGQVVRIKGYMFGGLFQTSGIRSFPLVKDKECAFGEGCQPTHAVQVELAGELRASFTTEPVTVEGSFHIRPWTGPNGKTWSLYRMEVTKME